MLETTTIIWIFSIIFTAGVTAGGFKFALNGTRKNIAALQDEYQDMSKRLVRVEATLELIHEIIDAHNNHKE